MKPPKEFGQLTLFLSKPQHDELMSLAQKLGCNDVIEFLEKSIEFSSMIAKARLQDFDLFAVAKQQQIINSKDGRVMIVLKDKQDYKNITSEVDMAFDINQQVKQTNCFGMTPEEFIA